MKKTMKAKRITALLMAAVMGASLAACGEGSNKPGGATESTTQSAIAPDVQMAEVQSDPPSEDDSFDLTEHKFAYTGEFCNGYAWVSDENSRTYYLIDKSGKKYSQVELNRKPGKSSHVELTPVYDGAFFANTSSHDDRGGVIMDLQGNTLYTLPDEEDNYESCLASGDGYYLLRRHTSDFDSNVTGYVIVDKNGKELTELVTELKPDYSSYDYLSDGVFAVGSRFVDATNPAGLVPYPADGDFTYSVEMTYHDPIISKNGRLWVWMEDYSKSNGLEKGMALIDAHTFDYTHISSKDPQIHGTYAVADHVYYDIDGNQIDLSRYGDKATDCSPISDEGLIAVTLAGKDGHGYLAYVDTQGNEKTAPFKFHGTYGYKYDEYHYCKYEDGKLTVYNPDGTQVMQAVVGNSGDKGWLILKKDYVICNDQYYFF